MRHIEHHKITALNEQLIVSVHDEPGHGGACHKYTIRPVGVMNESDVAGSCQRSRACVDIHFQEGPLNEHGCNGISNEALLAICMDRLEGFQSGNFACDDNQQALYHLKSALECLHRRTRERVERGVEGTSQQ